MQLWRIYSDDNELKDRMQHIKSPSAKYELIISYYKTGKYSWNYTRGQVKNADGKIIATIDRNYSSFPFLFIEKHSNGHDYLVCGADYQGQTVIELDTGKRLDYLPETAKNGGGFCWTKYKYNYQHQVLIVSGCVWSHPFEFKFYDFSNPMNGGIEIHSDVCIIDDRKWPTFDDNGNITTYKSHECFDDDDDIWSCDNGELAGVIIATHTFRRDGDKLILCESWESLPAIKSRMAHEDAEEKAALLPEIINVVECEQSLWQRFKKWFMALLFG